MTEQQPYEVVDRQDGFELRRYLAHLVAEVDVGDRSVDVWRRDDGGPLAHLAPIRHQGRAGHVDVEGNVLQGDPHGARVEPPRVEAGGRKLRKSGGAGPPGGAQHGGDRRSR